MNFKIFASSIETGLLPGNSGSWSRRLKWLTMDLCGRGAGQLSLKGSDGTSGQVKSGGRSLILRNCGACSDCFHENLAFLVTWWALVSEKKVFFFQALSWFFFKEI